MLLLAKVDVSGEFRQWTCWAFPSYQICPPCVKGNPKNATRTSAIYGFCFTKFMREMVRINNNTPHELQQMLQELADERKNQGLTMNNSKTKVMIEYDPPIYVTNTRIENIKSYIRLGHRYSTRDKNQDKEIQRRITAGWTAFAKHSDIFKDNIGTCLKRQIYNSCVLPAMTYGAETWTLTIRAKNKLAAAQTKMETSMLNSTYRDRNINAKKRQEKG